jgi:hypothetical protein
MTRGDGKLVLLSMRQQLTIEVALPLKAQKGAPTLQRSAMKSEWSYRLLGFTEGKLTPTSCQNDTPIS